MAAPFPVKVVCDLVDLPEDDRDRLLDRANAAINLLGPANRLVNESMWAYPETLAYIQTYAARDRIRPGSFGLAFEEALRLESPVQFIGRRVTKQYDADGPLLQPGHKVIALYGCANRDERKFPDPDAFDVSRQSNMHLAFSAGRHICAGQGLARLEGISTTWRLLNGFSASSC